MICTNPNKLSVRILDNLRHVPLTFENFTAKIFSSSGSVSPDFRYKANWYFMDFLKQTKLKIYMTSSVLNFRVSHKTCLARTNDITIIVTSRELHTWYTFLSSFLARMLFNFVAKKISNEIVFCVDFSIAPFNLKIKKIGKTLLIV